jgi:phage gp36-like protein
MVQASVRALAISAGIDLGRRYKDQSITKLSKLMHAVSLYGKTMRMALADIKQARETEPYLAKFEDDWATGQILRQYINGKQKYENAKANGKVTVGRKRNKTSPSDDDIEQATSNSEGDNNGGGSEGGDKWLGLNYPDHEMDEWGV